ncbi:MAG: OmpA family protein [Nitrospira sp.]|nr:OmpA family protein [Nitrospira sp.]
MKRTFILITLFCFFLSGCLTGEIIVGGVMFHAPVLSLLLAERNGTNAKAPRVSKESLMQAKEAKLVEVVQPKVEPPKPSIEIKTEEGAKPLTTIEVAKVYDLNRGFDGLDKLQADLELLSSRLAKLEEGYKGPVPEIQPAPAPALLPPPPPTEEKTILMSVVLSDIAGSMFKLGSAKLTPHTKKRLDKFAEELKGKTYSLIEITGHTDNRGSEEYNMKLGQKRADAVMDYLSKKRWVDRNLITIKSFGESKPIADNKKLIGRKQNRRVEITVYKKLE